jgi:hypothetical protein
MVYVKYRCRRCKRMGEAFIPQEEWDWSIFEVPRNEMSEAERDRFQDKQDISAGDVLNFHRDLKRVHNLSDLMDSKDGVRGRSKTDVKEKGDGTKGRRGNGGSSEKHRRPGTGG